MQLSLTKKRCSVTRPHQHYVKCCQVSDRLNNIVPVEFMCNGA